MLKNGNLVPRIEQLELVGLGLSGTRCDPDARGTRLRIASTAKSVRLLMTFRPVCYIDGVRNQTSQGDKFSRRFDEGFEGTGGAKSSENSYRGQPLVSRTRHRCHRC